MIPPRIKYTTGKLLILDQRLIPFKIKYYLAKNPKHVAKAIKDMMVRGAPLIGDSAAFGYLLGIDEIIKNNIKGNIEKILEKNKKILENSRPTAIALFKATERLHKIALKKLNETNDIKEVRRIVEKEVFKIIEEDISSTYNIAKNGLKLLKKNSNVITYCNTGALATAGIGTALGIITEGYRKGKISHVYPCETRPYLQGLRLTAWELMMNKIPYTIICDNMSGHLMKTKKIDAVIIGADRIATNGDTANKIGSYTLALAAQYHSVPFYVAAPIDTFDLNIIDGKDIKIEEREPCEVIKIKNIYIAHPKTKAWHPAFDIVPNNLITAIITDKGIIEKPNKEKIKKFFEYLSK